MDDHKSKTSIDDDVSDATEEREDLEQTKTEGDTIDPSVELKEEPEQTKKKGDTIDPSVEFKEESEQTKEGGTINQSFEPEEEDYGEDAGYLPILQDELLPPESPREESTETTTPDDEPYEEGTTFYFEAGEEQEYQPTTGEYEEERKSDSAISQIYPKLSPFFVKWSYGVKTATKLINLTKEDQFEVFYVASHFGVLYNYRTNTMRFLPGHNSAISSIAADATGRWLVTADDGEDNVIIIWDHQRLLPCWSLFNIFPETGTKCVQISQDARFLTAVSSDARQRCKFFLWTFGRDQADGEIELGSGNGNVTNIQFNHVEATQFAITMETKVAHCQWVPEKKILESFLSEMKKRKGKIGIFRNTIFLDDNHTSVTSTSSGHVIVWSDTLHIDPNPNTKGSIKKKFVKAIRIHKSGISSLLLVDQTIVSSSDEGMISFHDQSLILLYLVRKYQVEPIVGVSCNLQEQSPDQVDPFSEYFDDPITSGSSSQDIEYIAEEWDDEGMSGDEKPKSKEVEIVDIARTDKNMRVPSDYTIDKKSFYTRDLMFLTWNGRIGYVSHRRGKVRYFLHGYGATVLCMDCNPNVPQLATGNSVGRVDLFDYKSTMQIVSNVVADTAIVALRYSPTGRYLMAGLTNGTALLLEPTLLTLKLKIQFGRAEIRKFCFTSNETLFAYYDSDNTVYLSKISGQKHKMCTFMGGYKSHYKPIRDILFDEEYDLDDIENYPRLYTLGEDRMLVEYDVRNSTPGKLKVKRIDRIEQTAIPECFMLLPRFGKSATFLVANSEYKFKVVCRDTRVCYKTTLGPTADTPPNFMKIIPSWKSKSAKMIYTTERHIGLRLLPSTGNPYEGMGMVGHPVKITSIAISNDYKYVFTAGLNDACVLAWKVNTPSVEIAYQLGGTGLEPFACLIEGGTDGFLYKEMEDFFYYSQIIHQGEHANVDRSVAKSLALCEIPDLVRSMGYFPTEYEIGNIIREVKHARYDATGEYTSEVSFDDCVKIYLNHRPVNGISFESINKALLSIADLSDPECIIVEKDELYRSLEERGEAMSHAELIGYLCILLLPKDEKDPVPASMTLKDFAEDVLGIDLTITEDNVREVTHPSENKAA